jgi:hypothetical protein
MKYEQTVGGYFYKIYSNGNRKRVSKEVFDKNVMKGGANGGLANQDKLDSLKYLIGIYQGNDSYRPPSNINKMNIDQLKELLEFYKIRQEIKLYTHHLPENFNSMNIEQLKDLRDQKKE